jgi:NAD(P)-dependent dehydrogenase (short-subunit alcohol dehydrogenase family)
MGPLVARAIAKAGWALLMLAPDTGVLNSLATGISRDGGRTGVVRANLSDPHELGRVIAEARAWIGRIDALVCNAAPQCVGPGAQLLIDDLGTDNSASVYEVELLARHLLPAMVRRDWGRVLVFCPRTSGHMVSQLPRTSAGQNNLYELTRRLAADVGRSGVTVNAIAPSWTNMDSMNRSISEQSRYLGLPAAALARIREAYDAAAGGTTEGWVYSLTQFLLGESSADVNGLIVPVIQESIRDSAA